MGDPISLQSELITKLAAFLTQETIAFYSDINWQYYKNVHSPGDTPAGAVYIPKIKPDYQNNYTYYSKQYQIFIRLLISNNDEFELIKSLNNWCGHLLDKPLRKLRKDGFDDLFRGIDVVDVSINSNINQDRGGTGQLTIVCNWKDEATVTNRYDDFALG